MFHHVLKIMELIEFLFGFASQCFWANLDVAVRGIHAGRWAWVKSVLGCFWLADDVFFFLKDKSGVWMGQFLRFRKLQIRSMGMVN